MKNQRAFVDYISGSNPLIFVFCCVLFLGCEPGKILEIYFEDQSNAGFPFRVETGLMDRESEKVFRLNRSGEGNSIYAQKLNDETLVFILDEDAEAGETRHYRIQPAGNDFPERILVDSGVGSVTFSTAGQQDILTYHTEEKLPAGLPDYYRRSGFIHPLFSPKGLILTDDFPAGHSHQHGIFSAWVNTTFKGDSIDFWNQQSQTGTVGHDSIISIESGPVFGRLRTAHSYISLEFGEVLQEEWDLTIFSLEEAFLLDLSIYQVNKREDTLYISDYIYGGLAFRGNAVWNREDSLRFQSDIQYITAEGKGREAGNHTRPGWVAAFGDSPDGLGGVAVIDHKDNLNYPQPVRIHPEMPYFCMAPMVNNAFTIPPQESYQARYRLLSFDGPPPNTLIERAAYSLNQH